MGTLTSWNPLGLSRPVMGLFYLFTVLILNSFSFHCLIGDSECEYCIHGTVRLE